MSAIDNEKVLGIDLGGTNVRAGVVENGMPQQIHASRISTNGSVEKVMSELFDLVDQAMEPSVKTIGIGVPGLVDVDQGIVYSVINIPSWKEVHLKKIMEDRYQCPVLVNNDANCFALGEKYFGKGRGAQSMIGLVLGTGIAGGIIINDRLYIGSNCGAGEFGMVEYRDQYYEYYASGQYFENVHDTTGERVFRKAQNGDPAALKIFNRLGIHIGNAIKTILYAFDPKRIILGGSVSQAYSYFERTMWEEINTLAFPKSLEDFRVEVSELDHSGVIGAAALYYNGG